MQIDINEIIMEIEKLKRDFFRVKSHTDFKSKYFNIATYEEIYRCLTGINLNIVVPNNRFYVERFVHQKAYYDNILDEFYKNQSEHNRLSGKIISTFNRSNYKSLNLQDGTRKISIDNGLEIIYDFLNNFNPKMINIFKQLIDNSQINLLICDEDVSYDGLSYHFSNYPKNYILTSKFDNLNDLNTLIHEFGHVYAFKIIENRSLKQQFNTNNTFIEMPSSYMELCFQDYLKKNHIFLKDTYILENYYYVLRSFFKELKKFPNKNELDVLKSEKLYESFIYSYGYYLGMLMHELTLKDKEGTKERIDDFLCNQGLLSYDEQLNILGYDRDKLKNMKVLKKRLETHSKEINSYIKIN